MIDFEDIQKQIQKSFHEKVDEEIKGILTDITQNQTHQTADPIKDLQDMICKMTTVITCIPNMKEKIEKETELPNMTRIIPNTYLEDDVAYLIKDEKLKKSLLGYGNEWEFFLDAEKKDECPF